MKHTEETITDVIVESHDIIRSIWRGWENKVKNDIKEREARDKARRSTIEWQIRHTQYKPSYSYESPQERGQRMRQHNDTVARCGYGSSYF